MRSSAYKRAFLRRARRLQWSVWFPAVHDEPVQKKAAVVSDRRYYC